MYPKATHGGPDYVTRIAACYDSLRGTERRIADFVRERGAEVCHLTATRVAQLTSTSEASVVRFCQALGYRGFQEFKFSLERDSREALYHLDDEIDPRDSVESIKNKVFAANQRALSQTLATLSEVELARAVQVLRRARTIAFFGQGGANSVVADAYHKFLNIGKPCVAHSDANLQAMTAALLARGDVAVGVSHSGAMRDVVEAIEIAKRVGATTIGITGNPRSRLAEVTDIKLITASKDTAFRNDNIGPRIAELTIIDTLWIATAMGHYDEAIDAMRKTKEATSLKRC